MFKKLYVYGSEFGKSFQDAAGFGWTMSDPTLDWPTLRDNKSREISRLNTIYDRLLENSGAQVVHGTATLIDPNTVEVEGVRYHAKKILLATGSWPTMPDFQATNWLLPQMMFDLDKFPSRLLVLGGGYIATEFAGIFNGLGSQVVQLYRGEMFLQGFDDDIRTFAADEIRKTGVDLRFNTNITALEQAADGIQAT